MHESIPHLLDKEVGGLWDECSMNTHQSVSLSCVTYNGQVTWSHSSPIHAIPSPCLFFCDTLPTSMASGAMLSLHPHPSNGCCIWSCHLLTLTLARFSPSPSSSRPPHCLTASPSPLTLALRASLPPRLFFHRVATLAPPPSLETREGLSSCNTIGMYL